jgi:starvation-inducible DNA-binding protein
MTAGLVLKPEVSELSPPHEIQAFGTVMPMPIGLSHAVRHNIAAALNCLLADVMSLRDLYKKHHWQTSGPCFYSLHLLFDKHAGEQTELIDAIAERVMQLGGVAIAMAIDVAETTRIPRAPKGREPVHAQLVRILQAHETILEAARKAAKEASESGDDGTNDLLAGDVIRTNEMQVWFVSEHLREPRSHA